MPVTYLVSWRAQKSQNAKNANPKTTTTNNEYYSLFSSADFSNTYFTLLFYIYHDYLFIEFFYSKIAAKKSK